MKWHLDRLGGKLCNGEVNMWLTIILEGKLWLTKIIFRISSYLYTYSCTLRWHLGSLGSTLCNGEVNMWLTIFLEGKLWLIKFILHISPYPYLLIYSHWTPG